MLPQTRQKKAWSKSSGMMAISSGSNSPKMAWAS
jgi:hypothetical protein